MFKIVVKGSEIMKWLDNIIDWTCKLSVLALLIVCILGMFVCGVGLVNIGLETMVEIEQRLSSEETV